MKTHKIKLFLNFCDDVLSGDKRFEIRENDRGYQKGDRVVFQPYEPSDPFVKHPISDKVYEITYVLNGWGLKDGYVVFGIREVKRMNNKTMYEKEKEITDKIGVKEAIKMFQNLIFAENYKIAENHCRKLAIEALEKQIAKKPTAHKVDVPKIKVGNGFFGKGTTVYHCPCCNELISRICNCCYKCGQALDWSEQNG